MNKSIVRNKIISMLLPAVVAVFLVAPGLLLQACGDKEGQNPVVDKPAVNTEDVNTTEGNSDHTIQVKVTLSKYSDANVILRYSTKDGSAVAGADYLAATDQSLIISAGQTEAYIPIQIKGDKINEPEEYFEVVILQATNGTLVRNTAKVTILNDDSGTNTIEVPQTGYVSPDSYNGYHLEWQDEFNGNAVNTAWWTFETGGGGWGNNELQYYRPENTYILDNSYLVIEAKKESYGGNDYTSSRMITKGKKEFKFGRIDIRAALPEGKGVWPALWMLGGNISSVGWPASGEIDIMELLGHNTSQVYGTAHWGPSTGQHQYKGSSVFSGAEGDFHDAFHVFSISWEQDKITWLVDDKPFYSITSAEMNGFDYPFNLPQFFIFNVAVGGNWPGSPDGSTLFSQYMIVDYVRVFQKN